MAVEKPKKREWQVVFDEAAADYYAARKIVYRNALMSAPTADQKNRMTLAAIRIADLMIDDGEMDPEIKQES